MEQGWLSRAFSPPAGTRGMKEDFDEGLWVGDDLLAWVTANLDKFYWQSHTLTHLIRDNLGAEDCAIEDGGEARRRGRRGCCWWWSRLVEAWGG